MQKDGGFMRHIIVKLVSNGINQKKPLNIEWFFLITVQKLLLNRFIVLMYFHYYSKYEAKEHFECWHHHLLCK